MPVHLFGRPAVDFSGFGLPVIEDAAQAFGAGGIATSVASTFSFFPTKNLFALGDGGLISVNDAGARAAPAHAALPRVGREEGVPLRRLQLAPRRDAGGVPAHLPASHRRLEREPPRSRRALLRAPRGRRRDAGGRGRPRLPHVLRPLAGARSARGRARQTPTSVTRSTTSRRCTCSPRCATSATRRATSRRRRRRPARTSACRSGPASTRSSRPRSCPSSSALRRSCTRRKCASRSIATGSGSSSSTRS